MRLSIYGQFIVGVVRPRGGWSKGRPIAYIEDDDKCVPLFHLLIPNDLDDEEVARYVGDKFDAFSEPGKSIAAIDGNSPQAPRGPQQTVRRRDVAHPPAFAGVQR
jgi:hypothetical protein